MPSRRKPYLCGLVAATIVAFALPAPALPARGCLPVNKSPLWKAVFGHYATTGEARSMEVRARKSGFREIAIEDDGCGLFEVVVSGLGGGKQRNDFVREASQAGFEVSLEPPGSGRSRKPSDWVAVFGHFRTVKQANALLTRAASSGFRVIDIVQGGPAEFKVVVANVPSSKAQAFGAQAKRAGFSVLFEVG